MGVGREQAIETAWRLLSTAVSASKVREVEAKLIDQTWSVLFHKRHHADYVDTPGFWLILMPESGQAEWFECL